MSEPPDAVLDSESEPTRFEVELEFVQCLGNPRYLNFLAQHGYLEDPRFVQYLSYLLYWKAAEYARFIKYPHCLQMLTLLQQEAFRKEVAHAQFAQFADDQQLLHWLFYNSKRVPNQESRSTA